MGWPSESVIERQIRNPMDEVQRFFQVRHPLHHKVYNLCSERHYAEHMFNEQYSAIRFPDHNPCRLKDLLVLCRDIEEYLHASKQNVVAIHCKAGKGRTGLVIASYLLHCREFSSAHDALADYGQLRTHNAKGVTIPSQ